MTFRVGGQDIPGELDLTIETKHRAPARGQV